MTAVSSSDATANDAENTLVLNLSTGQVKIQMFPDLAPKHVDRIKQLVREGFYDGIIFHRVIDDFMAQTGDPSGTGRGGSSYPDIPAEFNNYEFKRGTVGMARSSNPDSANSQFFICFSPTYCRGLTGDYTVWGQVSEGMENVDKVAVGEPPRNPDSIVSAVIEADAAQ